MCVHTSETSEVSNEHAETILGSGSESKAVRGQCTDDFRSETKNSASWLLNPLARWARQPMGEGIRRCSVWLCEVLHRRRSGPEALRARGKYTPEGMPEIMSGCYRDEGYAVPYMWAAILI